MLATSLVFVLLAEKYSEIAARYSGGGGVVSVADDAFGPRTGALGGMLILVDYFLTAAISAVSGFTYLATLFPALHGFEPLLAVVGLLLLGVLNWVGIRESAQVSALIGTAAFASAGRADRSDGVPPRRRRLASHRPLGDGGRRDPAVVRRRGLRGRLARLQRPRVAGADLAGDGDATAAHARHRDVARRGRGAARPRRS